MLITSYWEYILDAVFLGFTWCLCFHSSFLHLSQAFLPPHMSHPCWEFFGRSISYSSAARELRCENRKQGRGLTHKTQSLQCSAPHSSWLDSQQNPDKRGSQEILWTAQTFLNMKRRVHTVGQHKEEILRDRSKKRFKDQEAKLETPAGQETQYES